MENTNDFTDIKRIGELSNDGVFIYHFGEEKFYYINKIIPAIFLESGEAILSSSQLVLKFIKAEDSYYLSSRINELLETGCITSTEFRLEFPDSSIKHISCDAYVMENRIMIVGFVKDI